MLGLVLLFCTSITILCFNLKSPFGVRANEAYLRPTLLSVYAVFATCSDIISKGCPEGSGILTVLLILALVSTSVRVDNLVYVSLLLISYSSFFSSGDAVSFYISLEMVFTLVMLVPLMVATKASSESKLSFLVNIVRWNIPTTLANAFLMYTYCSSGEPLSFMLGQPSSVGYWNYPQLLVLIILLKISVPPLVFYKYKLYSLLSFDSIASVNLNYFWFLQVWLAPLLFSCKVQASTTILLSSTAYLLLLLSKVGKITNHVEFIAWASFTSYINTVFIFFF